MDITRALAAAPAHPFEFRLAQYNPTLWYASLHAMGHPEGTTASGPTAQAAVDALLLKLNPTPSTDDVDDLI